MLFSLPGINLVTFSTEWHFILASLYSVNSQRDRGIVPPCLLIYATMFALLLISTTLWISDIPGRYGGLEGWPSSLRCWCAGQPQTWSKILMPSAPTNECPILTLTHLWKTAETLEEKSEEPLMRSSYCWSTRIIHCNPERERNLIVGMLVAVEKCE